MALQLAVVQKPQKNTRHQVCLSIRLGVGVDKRKFQRIITTAIKSKGLLTNEKATIKLL